MVICNIAGPLSAGDSPLVAEQLSKPLEGRSFELLDSRPGSMQESGHPFVDGM
jgi:hypothetical protein